MKLFYILMLTALLGLFGLGCQEDAPGENTPNPPEAGFFVIKSDVRTDIDVSSADISITLEKGCVKVSQEQINTLEISIPKWFGTAQVLCGVSEDDGSSAPCEPKHVTVVPGQDDVDGNGEPDEAMLIATENPTDCTRKLEAKAADPAETPAADPETPAADPETPAADPETPTADPETPPADPETPPAS